jgi:NitT/TauT family transport system substrate-binding protein
MFRRRGSNEQECLVNPDAKHKMGRLVMTRMSVQAGLIVRSFMLLVAGILCLAVSSPVRAQQKVSIGAVGSVAELTFYIAEQRGYFAAEGITPEYVKFPSATQMIAPLATGELNVASGSVSAALFNAVARGIPVKIVADNSSAPPGFGSLQLMVRKDLIDSGRVKTLADLKGMKVASSAKGGQGDVALYHGLRKVGLAFSDIQAVYMGHAELVPALQNGALDAALETEPDATIAEAMGVAVRFMTVDQLYPNEQVGVLIYGPDFASKSRELGNRFMRAYVRAARVYNDALVDGKIAGPGAEELIALLVRRLRVKDPAVLKRMRSYGLNPDVEVNVEGLRNDLKLYREWGLIHGNPTVDQALDQSFAREARAGLPPYRKASAVESGIK